MPTTEPHFYAVQREFNDFDELEEEVRQWDLDLFQLDRGAFRASLLQFGIGNVHVSEARFCRGLIQKGTPPTGLRTIVVPSNPKVEFVWRGNRVSGDDLMIFPTGAELEATSNLDFHVYTCSFPEELLASICDAANLPQLDALRGDASVMRCRSDAIESVRGILGQLTTAVGNSELPIEFPGLLKLSSRELPRRLLSAISTSHPSFTPEMTRKRELALLRAEDYIKRNATEDITVRDICSVAQVSQRTLEYAFVERFGLTPKAFLTFYRLNGARRALRAADFEKAKVADIANRWSFWHMGQFAADYRNLFGELPSATLRRANERSFDQDCYAS